MSSILEAESRLSDGYRTTVPELVRRALGLGKGDRIRYTIRPGGEVVLSRATPVDVDPVLTPFLALLAADIAAHPERLQGMDAGLVQRIRALVGDVPVDLDSPVDA